MRFILVMGSGVVSAAAAFAVARTFKSANSGTAQIPASPVESALPGAAAQAPPPETSSLIAEWEKLRSEFGTSLDAFPAVFATVKDIKDSFRRRAFRAALIAEWVGRDAPGALKFFRDKKDPANAAQALREWLRLDANAAVSGLMASGAGWQSLSRDLLSEVARVAPHRVPEMAAQLPKPNDRWDARVRDAFEIVAAGGIDSARQAAEGLEGWARVQALEGVARAFGQKDGAAAMAWARSLPAAERDDALRAALTGWAKSQPLEALGHVNEVPPGGDQMMYASDVGARVLQEAAKVDFDGTLRWLKENPGQLGHDSLTGLTNELSKRLVADPAGTLELLRRSDERAMSMVLANSLLNEGYARKDDVWKWLSSQPADSFTDDLRRTLIRSAAWKDPDHAIALMEQLPDTEQSRQIFRECAGNLINNGGDAARLDDLLGKVSPRLRPHLLDAALRFGGRFDWDADEAQKWIARIDELEPQSRTQGLVSVAGRWATNDPEGAAQWAQSLPNESERNAALSSLVASWAVVDSYEASQWIADLPEGAARDGAAGALVSAIAQAEPDSAWEWAQAIKSDEARRRALSAALRSWHAKDPSAAQNILDGATLPAAEKESLRQQLQNLPRAGAALAAPVGGR